MGLSPGTNHSGRRALCFYQTQRLREEAESQRSERDFEPFLRSSSPSFLLPSFLTPLFLSSLFTSAPFLPLTFVEDIHLPPFFLICG